MLTWPFPLDRLVGDTLKITYDEAIEMSERGFRFSIFQPSTDEFALSRPFEMLVDRDHGKLTVQQPAD